MLDYLADKSGSQSMREAGKRIDDAVYRGFEANRIRPMEFGGDMGTRAVAEEITQLVRTG